MARGAGCGCKLAPDVLARALAHLPPLPADPRVLVGHERMDDAAVYRVADDLAVVASVDFFTPMVDDPRTFGAIAATNALSDLYAMGATPAFALAVACFPRDGDPATLGAIMAGGAAVAAAHGCPVLGGHTIDDPEPKYGLSVLGTAHPDDLMTNAAGRPGDALVLTKAIGVGVAITAARDGDASALDAAVASMLASNREAAATARAHGVRCATDVTGFGLLGHLVEMTKPSGVDAEIRLGALPLLTGAIDTVRAGIFSSLQPQNVRLRRAIRDGDSLKGDPRYALLFDPQTAGGLLAGVPEAAAAECVAELKSLGYAAASVIGRVLPSGDGAEPIRVLA